MSDRDADEKTGRFLVTHAEDDSAVLKNVDDGQVHTLGENPGVEPGDVLDARLAPEPPMELTWVVVEVESRRSLSVERSTEPPTARERDIGETQDEGEITREERAGKGEIHVITVPDDRTDEAVDDVLDDEGTLVRAARMDEVVRVEVRAESGVVAVRYLP
ncbi:DUF5812 family protein [Halomarina rubra]|uniref:DUF5812 family protein n=1 Tax=Halomarina rubra TaxID=2071873 RepID=A0ABD6AVI5_9EURY|nr:DUF5812 family protein [Halomarina rubra]